MRLGQVRRGAGAALLVGSVAFAGALVGSPTANAAISYGRVVARGTFYGDTTDCTLTGVTASPTSLPLTDNGYAVSQSYSSTGRWTSKTDAADVTDMRMSSTVTAKVSPIVGGPARIDVTAAASASAVAAKGGASACSGNPDVRGDASFDFTLTVPMWVTLSASTSGDGRGNSEGSVSIGGDNGRVSVSSGGKGSGSTTALLVPGEYSLDAQARVDAYVTASDPAPRGSVSGAFSAVLSPVGAAGAQTGTGGRFVSFGARSCATGSVAASLGKAVKRKAKRVQLSVNGKKRVTIAKPKKLRKTRSVVLGGIVPTAPATVTAVVTLKNGKKVTVSRSYLACS